ncbi:MAG: hypothetical protein ABIH21_04525 [Patescibacteria group bacterium]
MSKTPNYDNKIKSILDATQPGERVCELTGQKWMLDQRTLQMLRDFNLPVPVFSPRTFLMRLLILLTGFSWWWNKDYRNGKPLITATHPHTKYKVMIDDDWHKEDFSSISQEIDLSSSVLDQLVHLAFEVPLSAYRNFKQPVNSIARHSLGDENSFFVEGTISKRCTYSADSLNIENSSEINWSNNVQDSYNVVAGRNINKCRVVRESRDCLNCDFIFDCRNCEYCFMSWNQRYKKFFWENKQLSEEEWKKRRAEVNLGSFDVFDNLYHTFRKQIGNEVIWPENFNEQSENTTGEYMQKCIDVYRGWFSEGAKNCTWTVWANLGTENCHWGCDPGSSDCFGNLIAVNCSRCFFSWIITRCQNCEYCIECLECENCFGCVGLKHKKFHIFNTSYEEAAYWEKIDQIKCAMLDQNEYGRTVPSTLMQTSFEHTGGFITFNWKGEEKLIGVLCYDTALDEAYGDWSNRPIRALEDLPKHINDVGDEWLGVGFMDEKLKRPFSIHPMELELHRRLGVPIRREHFIKRIEDQWCEINTMDILGSSCRACNKSIQIAHNNTYPDRKIYCRECYLRYLEQYG